MNAFLGQFLPECKTFVNSQDRHQSQTPSGLLTRSEAGRLVSGTAPGPTGGLVQMSAGFELELTVTTSPGRQVTAKCCPWLDLGPLPLSISDIVGAEGNKAWRVDRSVLVDGLALVQQSILLHRQSTFPSG